MSFPTPHSGGKSKSLKADSPVSVTLVEEGGNLKLNPEGLNYISTSFCSDDDPCLVIHWVQDGVMDALFEIGGNQILDLPQPPIFLDTSTPE